MIPLRKKRKKENMLVGWREWAALPELNIPAIKMKIDTGAKTSALHAFNVKSFEQDGQHFVSFEVHPLQKSKKVNHRCTARLVDERTVTSSNGHQETRLTIRTPIEMQGKKWDIDITLTKRDIMAYRMLLGREAMKSITVEPSKSFKGGKISKSELAELYNLRKPVL